MRRCESCKSAACSLILACRGEQSTISSHHPLNHLSLPFFVSSPLLHSFCYIELNLPKLATKEVVRDEPSCKGLLSILNRERHKVLIQQAAFTYSCHKHACVSMAVAE
jgi:hypothetical protein